MFRSLWKKVIFEINGLHKRLQVRVVEVFTGMVNVVVSEVTNTVWYTLSLFKIFLRILDIKINNEVNVVNLSLESFLKYEYSWNKISNVDPSLHL